MNVGDLESAQKPISMVATIFRFIQVSKRVAPSIAASDSRVMARHSVSGANRERIIRGREVHYHQCRRALREGKGARRLANVPGISLKA